MNTRIGNLRQRVRFGRRRSNVGLAAPRSNRRQRILCVVFCFVFTAAQVNVFTGLILLEKAAAAETKPKPLAVDQKVADAPATDTTAKTQQKVAKNTSRDENEPDATGKNKKRQTKRELTEKRTETSDTTLNEDGTITERHYKEPQYFDAKDPKDKKLKKIDNALKEDKNAASSSNIAGKALGQVKSVFEGEKTFKTTGNRWSARFAESNDKAGIVRIEMNGQSVSMHPKNAKNVAPLITTHGKQQIVNYYDLWPGVDVEYIVTNSKLKENVIIKNKEAQLNYAFDLKGADFVEDKENPGGFKIKNSLNNEFAISELTVTRNNHGPTSEKVISQKIVNNQLQVSLDKKWVQGLDKASFPLVVDPAFNSGHGLNYVAYKSDGYVCGSNSCYVNTGTLDDRGWKHWRTMFHAPYSQLQGKELLDASYYIEMVEPRPNRWFGTYDGRWVEGWHAGCFGFNCINWGAPHGATHMGWAGWINMTDTYRLLMNSGDWGGWMMLRGEEGPYTSYKATEDYASYMQFTYNTKPPAPTNVEPADGQVFIDPQVSLKVNGYGDPDGDPIQYYFRVATNPDAETGSIVNSGNIPNSQFTIPDGVLQEGVTYYWHAYEFDGIHYSPPSPVRSFRIDSRTGKDNTQTYDTVGPFSTGLATGNGTLNETSHTINALGGSIGVDLTYNTPQKSRNGLVGEYFGIAESELDAIITKPAAITRVDQNINFNWVDGSPAAGTIPHEWFGARWSGYFIVPVTGNYQFGIDADDRCHLWLNNEQIINGAGKWCGSGGLWSDNKYLYAGQVVPIKAQTTEAWGIATSALKVRGVIPEQVVPKEWLQTGVRPVSNQNGLKTRYYALTDDRNIPKDENSAFLTRVEPNFNMNFGTGSPVAAGYPDFMFRATGYITAPTTGDYIFCANADDRSRVKIGDTVVTDNWNLFGYGCGSTIRLEKGKPLPIVIDYYDSGGPGVINVTVKDGATEQTLPATWIHPQPPVVPEGWTVGVDPDGDIPYERVRILQNSAIFVDSTGETHEYTWTGSGYKPPVNEGGVVTKNADGTVTLQDDDGRVYIFNPDGTLKESVTASDDKKPAALRYEYSGTPAKLSKIIDGVDPNRYASVLYGGDSGCAAPYSGFTETPAGMLCAVKTTDGKVTNYFYKEGRIARVAQPGNDIVDFGYDTLGRIVQYRDTGANDVIAAGLRTAADGITTQVTYDPLGRIKTVKEPSAQANGWRTEHSYNYRLLGDGIWSGVKATGDNLASSPVTVSWGGDRIDLFARGAANDLVHKWFTNGTWSAWESLGGCIRENPSAASWAPGRLDVFAQGCNDTGNNMHHIWFDAGRWGGWDQPTAFNSMRIVGSPSAVSWGSNRLDFVARGSDNQLYQSYWTPESGWGGLAALGNCLSGSPTIVSSAPQKLDVYVPTCSNGPPSDNLQKRSWSPAGWTDFEMQEGAGNFTSINATKDGYAGIILAGRAANGNLRYRVTSSPTWYNMASCVKDQVAVTGRALLGRELRYIDCNSGWVSNEMTFPTGNTYKNYVGSTEPLGYTQRIQYDNLLRTIRDTDKTGKTVSTEWHPVKDLQLSTTDPTGMKSTTIYDSEDRPIDSYGPAPSGWFKSDGTPWSTYTNQTPHTQTKYDEGIVGPEVTWFDYSRPGTDPGNLSGSPKLRTTGLNPDKPGVTFHSMGTVVPITPSAGKQGVGFRAVGQLYLPAGKYWVNATTTEGVRIWVNDQLVVDSWIDAAQRTVTGGSFTVTNPSSPQRLKIDAYNKTGSTGGFDMQLRQEGGFGWTNDLTPYIKPGYGLATSTKVFDAQTGDVTNTTNYGARPEYGQAQNVIEDVGTGKSNLVTTSAFEAPGAGFLRQTSKTLPSGAKTNYLYYGANEARANPCVAGSAAVSQAGMSKGKQEPDPDGAGVAVGRTQETIYDTAGKIVATRFNQDPWTCNSYDDRGRTTQTVVPSIAGKPARTVTNTYAVNNNPLIARSTDEQGSITVENDILGQTIKYTDARGNLTTNTYSNFGLLMSRISPIGAESFEYDTYDRLVKQKLDTVTFATVTYDEFSRIATVAYPAGQSLSAITRDTLGRENSTTYTMANGQKITETVNRSVTGDIISGTENGVNKAYTYDSAGRLTKATLGTNTFTYEFGAQDASCSSLVGTNINSGKSSNRTKQTINGVATTYCYNQADQLIASSDQKVTTPMYDARGNTTSLGAAGQKTEFTYDASDRNLGIKQTLAAKTGANTGTTEQVKQLTYKRDVQNRIIERTNAKPGSTTTSRYGFTGSSDTPDFVTDTANKVTEKYVTLPGDVLVTLRAGRTSANATTYSFPNIHGDIMITSNADGTITGSFMTGPFGEAIADQSRPVNTMADASWNYVGQNEKLTEVGIALEPMQMGARVYIPSLGRFLQVDPVEGGVDNNYVYPPDSVNEEDLSGMCPMCVAAVVLAIGRVALTASAPIVVKQTAKQTVKQTAKQAAKQTIKKELKASSKDWSGGAKVMNKHYSQHGKALGYKNAAAYTRGARDVIKKDGTKGVPLKSGGRAFVHQNKVTVTYKGRVATHFKSKNVNNWLKNNRRR